MKARMALGLAIFALAVNLAFAQAGKSVSTQQLATESENVNTSAQTSTVDAQLDAVRKLFQSRFSDMEVTALRRTPYGLFEVQVGSDMIYTDAGVNWVMEGPLIDAVSRRDMTRASLEKATAVKFTDLPLTLALKQVKGDGSRQVAIFEDPNCGYCKRLRKTLEDVDNITVYTFVFPILSQDSHVKSRDVLCAPDPVKAWDDWMLRGKPPATAECNPPLDELLALGRKLGIRGTPTLFFADGSRVSGALPLAQLEARLK